MYAQVSSSDRIFPTSSSRSSARKMTSQSTFVPSGIVKWMFADSGLSARYEQMS